MRTPTSTLLLVLAATPAAAAPGGIDLATANRLVDGYARHALSQLPADWRRAEEERLREQPPRITAGGVYQILSPAGHVGFEFDGERQRLHAYSVIHKPRQEYPRIGLSREKIQAALEAAVAAGVDTGGGQVVWDEEARGFFLRRTWSEPPPSARQLNRDVDRLQAAGERWFREHYLAAVLARVGAMAPPPSATGRRDGLEVTILLTPDKRYQDLWRGPGRARPKVVTRSEFYPGQDVWALALFSGARADADGQVRLRAQYTFVYPDGSEHASPVGNLWWSTPPEEERQMSELTAAIEVGDGTPPGDYAARVMACDPQGQECVTAETPFRVVAEPAP